MNELALFGGKPEFTRPLKRYNSIGSEEVKAASNVIKTGVLSPFLGDWKDVPNVGSFYGGLCVQTFEKRFCKKFNVKYAIAVNSWTSGLICAVGAIGIEPGDEVIVSPWTMCATATAILHWCAIPVFVDIEDDTFNIDPDKLESKITKLTKAIIIPDIFGHPAQIRKIKKIAKRYKLKLISDTAQSILAKENGKFAGTLTDIGGFSFNFHKHMQTGEGGMLITNNKKLAERMQLIRNHGEAVVEGKGVDDISNIIGYNFRLGEIEAAIGIEQLKKINKLVNARIKIAKKLNKELSKLEGITIPKVKTGFTHSYYIYGMKYDSKKTKCSRDIILKALKAEGVSISPRYQNLHLLPMFQKKIAYGKKGFPWKSKIYKGKVNYAKGICPIAEKLNDKKLLQLTLCDYEYTDKDIAKLIRAFNKVWSKLNTLRDE